ncbi:hypothetical protein P171DRAFT_249936 [Karstenula rhodostoma CBS 690.94]|uniref:Uncharacterized protein n=1 Tax=Karstenula rhodostoma CBS 690.94 TaxID=1392251 RepID=A0A9P4PNM5_9PLEO|nr:hypothetical protein P171DRAFT_249936 [Karstenula rhodostoma CBS 690.94]
MPARRTRARTLTSTTRTASRTTPRTTPRTTTRTTTSRHRPLAAVHILLPPSRSRLSTFPSPPTRMPPLAATPSTLPRTHNMPATAATGCWAPRTRHRARDKWDGEIQVRAASPCGLCAVVAARAPELSGFGRCRPVSEAFCASRVAARRTR